MLGAMYRSPRVLNNARLTSLFVFIQLYSRLSKSCPYLSIVRHFAIAVRRVFACLWDRSFERK